MNQYRTSLKWIIALLFLFVLTACASSEASEIELAELYAAQTLTALPTEEVQLKLTETPEPTQTPVFTATPLPEVGPVGPVDFPENVNPLTGLAVADPAILDRRPVFVKVANYPESGRPHAGLSFADMVFEYYISAGTNRFMGLYYGQDAPKIGPVRSGRLVDPHIVSLYEGILGMESAYITIYDYILEILGNRVISGRSTCPAICDDGRQIVTSVFANSEAMTDYAEDRGVDIHRFTLEGMAFDPQAPEGGEPGERANIYLSSANRGEWHFDEERGLYLRWIESTAGTQLEMIPLVDSETDEQLAFSNVVVLLTNYTEIETTVHEIDIWGNTEGSRALVFRDGEVYDITWVTPTNDQPIQFLDEVGDPFPLKPGNTWVVIYGSTSGVTEEDGTWTINFSQP